MEIKILPGFPDFRDLPWDSPLDQWQEKSRRLVNVPHGVSRHTVVFVNYSGKLFCVKELPRESAQNEFDQLIHIQALSLPCVIPVGLIWQGVPNKTACLITRYLDSSIPYRLLLTNNSLERYRDHLLDAMAGLLVEMHVLGVFWGDCSLSNTLFKRDDGALRAYLVDAETALNWSEKLPPQKRFEDLNIMEDNVDGELADYYSMNVLSDGIPLSDIASSIRIRYQRLWDTLTQDVVLPPEERFRLQERIRNLNQLGYSIGEIRVDSQESGDKVHFKIIVTGKNFHRHRLFGMTGIDAEEMQARKIMNEIQEIKAMLSWEHNRSTPLSVAAHYWYEQIYLPTIKRLQTQSDSQLSPCELYCQVLEHKWYLSEKAKRDVGRQVAVEDYYTNVLKQKEIKMSENFFDVAERRRSIRSFVSSPVEEEMIQKILEAANRAPSAGNMQAYEVYIIRDQAQKLALARASLDQDFLASASIVLVFCSHPARSKERYGARGVELYCLQDATIACTFAMLAATAIGLGTVWIGAFNDEAVWKVIGSPEGQIPVVILPIGYPAENPAPRSRRKIDDLIHEL